jgi:hypothetical protein
LRGSNPRRPHIELHRIAFAERKTARAAPIVDQAADARTTRGERNAEAGLSAAWPLRAARRGPESAEGDKTSREASDRIDATRVSNSAT